MYSLISRKRKFDDDAQQSQNETFLTTHTARSTAYVYSRRVRDASAEFRGILSAAIVRNQVPSEMTLSNFLYCHEAKLPSEERIELLELLGSTCILHQNYIEGLGFWKKALQARQNRSSRLFIRAADDHMPGVLQRHLVKEWSDLNDINLLEQEIKNESRVVHSVFQALATRYRSINSIVPQDVENLFYITRRYAMKENIDILTLKSNPEEVLNIEMIQLILLLLECDWLCGDAYTLLSPHWYIKMKCLLKYVTLGLLYLHRGHLESDGRHRALINLDNTLIILKFLVKSFDMVFVVNIKFKFHNPPHPYEGFAHTCLHILLMASSPLLSSAVSLDEQQIREVRKLFRRLLAAGLRNDKGRDLLQLVCDYSTPYQAQAGPLVRMMIEEGANVRNVDDEGNNCLHFLIQWNGELKHPALVDLLLENGAHWDAKNKAGCSFLDLIRSRRGIGKDKIPSTLIPYISLKCLCAQVVRRHFKINQLDPTLVSRTVIQYVEFH